MIKYQEFKQYKSGIPHIRCFPRCVGYRMSVLQIGICGSAAEIRVVQKLKFLDSFLDVLCDI